MQQTSVLQIPSLSKRKIFRRQGAWQEAVDTYCDNLFGTLCKALYDRTWVDQVTWTPVINAAVKDLFPPEIVANIRDEVLDLHVASSAERAFEESRFWYA